MVCWSTMTRGVGRGPSEGAGSERAAGAPGRRNVWVEQVSSAAWTQELAAGRRGGVLGRVQTKWWERDKGRVRGEMVQHREEAKGGEEGPVGRVPGSSSLNLIEKRGPRGVGGGPTENRPRAGLFLVRAPLGPPRAESFSPAALPDEHTHRPELRDA